MSADKDRGIRRQKQKRAKTLKKDARLRQEAAVAKTAKAGAVSKQQAA